MKRLISLFIVVLFLFFAVSVNAAWLSGGWDQRIKLTVDNTKIDSALSHFPVTVILSSTHGDCVFDQLTSDGNRFKIAFTKTDGTTQLYGEIEKWDDANESAIIHVSLSGWSIASAADTDFYMYYDVDHADNSIYIGDIDSTPGHSVWDSNFKFVCHTVDATTSSVKDSTSNGNDGTKKAANEPIETTGKVGKGQDFDGADDAISLADSQDWDDMSTAGTVETIFKSDINPSGSEYRYLVARRSDSSSIWILLLDGPVSSVLRFWSPGGTLPQLTMTAPTEGTYYHVSFVWDSSNSYFYKNGVQEDSDSGGTAGTGTIGIALGHRFVTSGYELDGVLDETRLSSINRSAAWIKATYNTLYNTLLTYGSEETEGVTSIPQIIMF